MESQALDDETLEKIEKTVFVNELVAAKAAGFKPKITVTVDHPTSGASVSSFSFEPNSFTFNRVIEKNVNEKVEIWRFIHAALSPDDIDSVYEMQQFHDSLHNVVKTARQEKNKRVKQLKEANMVTKLKTKLGEYCGANTTPEDDEDGEESGYQSAGGVEPTVNPNKRSRRD